MHIHYVNCTCVIHIFRFAARTLAFFCFFLVQLMPMHRQLRKIDAINQQPMRTQ